MTIIDDNSFSIIVPVYQEAKNIPILIQRLANAGFTKPFEVIMVDDDSQDDTVNIVNALIAQYPWLKLIVRKQDRSWCKSILEGMRCACFPILVFMDADLSHPPEKIPYMLTQLEQADIDMVIGSRYMQGAGIDDKWPLYRNLISRIATWPIKPLLPRKISDPLSGFIAFRQAAYMRHGKKWNPIGTKLGLEVMVKSSVRNIVEVPIFFEQRKYGESKLINLKSAIRYAKQVKQLWTFKLFG